MWYCDAPITELQQLKGGTDTAPSISRGAAAVTGAGGSAVWKLAVADVSLTPGQTECSIEFELPLLANALMVELTDWHVSVNDAAGEVLHCPRCSHIVTDKHGMCGYCR